MEATLEEFAQHGAIEWCSVDRRVISYGGSAVAVEYTGARAAGIVDFVYRYAPTGGDTLPHVTYRILPDEATRRLVLYRDNTLFYQGESDVALADILMGDSCRHLVDRSGGGLLFHSAALMWEGRCLILPGTIGAGKSTLTAWLISRGFSYLTDRAGVRALRCEYHSRHSHAPESQAPLARTAAGLCGLWTHARHFRK